MVIHVSIIDFMISKHDSLRISRMIIDHLKPVLINRQHVEIEDITEDVKTLAGQILNSTAKLGQAQDTGLTNLILNCEALSDELLQLLAKLRRKNGKIKSWQSAKATMHGIRGAKEVQNIEKRLWILKDQICLHLTANLRQVEFDLYCPVLTDP